MLLKYIKKNVCLKKKTYYMFQILCNNHCICKQDIYAINYYKSFVCLIFFRGFITFLIFYGEFYLLFRNKKSVCNAFLKKIFVNLNCDCCMSVPKSQKDENLTIPPERNVKIRFLPGFCRGIFYLLFFQGNPHKSGKIFTFPALPTEK